MNNQDHFCIIKFQMADNAGIALSDLQAGHAYPLYTCQGEYLGDLRIAEAQPPWSLAPSGPAIPRYHKVATGPIAKNDPIIKDAVPIGLVSEEVMEGQLVHQHIEIETGHMVRRGGNILEYPNLFSPPPEKMATLASAYTVFREGYDKIPSLRPPEMEVPADAPLISVYRREGGVIG
ncbi:MAG: hypothetical protein NTY64_24670, partial [Deltaproteobacteria bacterium]|nr:hypothetical protein [Deltaproteobacteria bacterium]